MHFSSLIFRQYCFSPLIGFFFFLVLFSLTAAENLGFTSYPPAYLSKEANGKNLLIGANFGSAGSGYYEYTAKLYVKRN